MTYTKIFNELAVSHMIIFVFIFGSVSLFEIYGRHKFGKQNTWKCDALFNVSLTIINIFIILIMLNDSTEKNATSLFIFGIAIIQTCKLLRDTSVEIMDHFFSKRVHDKQIKEIQRDSYIKVLEVMNKLPNNDEETLKEKLLIIRKIEEIEVQLLKNER